MENVTTPPPTVSSAPPPADNPTQYQTLQSLGTVAGAAAVLTMIYGIVTNLYANAVGKDLPSIWCHLIVLSLAALVVIAFNAKREMGTTMPQHVLVLVINTAVLYTSVAGATGIAANLSSKNKSGVVQTSRPKSASFFSVLCPERPLYGVSAAEHNEVVEDLEGARTVTDAVTQYQALSKDTALAVFLKVNAEGAPSAQQSSVSGLVLPTSGDSTESQTGTWVYCGQIINGSWTTKNFFFTNTPTPGMELKAISDVFERDALPRKITEVLWKLGEIEGTVPKGTRVKVLQVQKIEDDNYWLQIVKTD
ncbi:hypothetical protein [Flaviaesturariibacter aridisoli]|uniref:Uncharacterized protein n=1 Tax=Flaviaesturariibacter aridisoli TaxID=2545761 RepID=A0A4R4E8X8_9BACT|nr:hypothetical protein [Flaviaesturariibacter aridisoli]TCZ74551.1 hypothetical protein E0486_02690 [Flaviaesturariibacter aridisoli]